MASASLTLLVVVAADFDSAKKKGVLHLFSEYGEQGFFRRVILVSPYMRRDRRITLDGAHEMHEFGPRWPRFKSLLAPIHLLRVIRACVRLVKEERVQIIRATEPTVCGFVAWAASRLSGVPYCLSLHADYDALFVLNRFKGAPTIFGSRALIYPLERLTLRGAVRVLAIRRSLVGYALRRGVDASKIRVIPHGVDLALFTRTSAIDVRAQFNLPNRKIVAFAGRLSRENYVIEMLDAIALVAAERDDFVFVVAGSGDMEAEFKTRVASHPAAARVVRMIGSVPHDTVVALRRQCDVSICLMGGFSLIEACAAGKPVIAYDVDWHRELVLDGITGRLVPEHGVAAVAQALTDLLNDSAKATRMGTAARELAFAKHDLAVSSRTRQQSYAELLAHEAT